MDVLGYIMLLFGLAGWSIHLVFIIYAIRNNGILELNYNYYKEMYTESIIMVILFIFTIMALITNWR